MPISSSVISSFIDPARIDALLEPWVPDADDRRFVIRCILGEGPAHHRGANWVLLSLLGIALERAGGGPVRRPAADDSFPVPIRLPPHLARPGDERAFPLPLPAAPLALLAPPGSREQAAMVDCLTDGPPQHALANAAMVCLLEALLDRLGARGP
jgi:hypothetical protein